MLKRLTVLVGFVLLLALAVQPARADDPAGAKLFATDCAACHGAGGKGGAAPAIGSEEFLNAHDDAAITKTTAEGVMAKGMPAWSKAKGGTLTDSQIADIVAYLRSLAPSATAQTAPATPTAAQATANAIYVETKIEVSQVVDADGNIVVNALLKEYNGYPVSGENIAFSRPTLFGALDLGTAKTGANGLATTTLTNIPENGKIAAVFAGDKNWVASSTETALEPRSVVMAGAFNSNGVNLSLVDQPLLAPEGSLITPNPPLVPAALFLLVVGFIWTLYALVVSQVVGIWRAGRTANRQNTLTWKAK